MRYRSESRYTASEHSCHYVGNLFSNSSSGSIVTPPFIGRASFPPARAKQTATLRWYASRVHNPFPPHASPPPAASFRRFFLLSLLFPHIFIFSFVLSFTRYSCYDVSTFHARKADVYYRACLAISVPLLMLVLLLQPSLSACTSPEQGVPFLKLPFARVHILGVSSSFHARTRTMWHHKRCYRPPHSDCWCRQNIVRDLTRILPRN